MHPRLSPLAGIRADIRSVTFGDPFRVAEDDTGLWVASYNPGGLSRADDFWNGRILRIANGEAEPRVHVDFASDLDGAASRVPAMGLAPVPLWDGCPDGSVAVLDPVDRILHLYPPGGGSEGRRIPLPWNGRPLSHEERLGYVRAMMRAETSGTDVSDAEIERAAEDVLNRAGDQLPVDAPIGIDLRCTTNRGLDPGVRRFFPSPRIREGLADCLLGRYDPLLPEGRLSGRVHPLPHNGIGGDRRVGGLRWTCSVLRSCGWRQVRSALPDIVPG